MSSTTPVLLDGLPPATEQGWHLLFDLAAATAASYLRRHDGRRGSAGRARAA